MRLAGKKHVMNRANKDDQSTRGSQQSVEVGAGCDPIDRLEQAHAFHAGLCDMLEAIADSLPDEVDPLQCRQALTSLQIELPLHHKDEEVGLFPLLERRARPKDNLSEHLAQLSLEHATDESFADELSQELDSLSRGERPHNPNMLGYMLRGFFESYRRHLHWENTVLLPLARKRLTEADLDVLAKTMQRHRSTSNGPPHIN